MQKEQLDREANNQGDPNLLPPAPVSSSKEDELKAQFERAGIPVVAAPKSKKSKIVS